jgi:hypothetical protein
MNVCVAVTVAKAVLLRDFEPSGIIIMPTFGYHLDVPLHS